jgi:hypothetical protein
MCTHIEVAVPRDADVDAVSAVIVRSQLGSGTELMCRDPDVQLLSVLPWKLCHCGSALGSVRRPQVVDDAAFEAQLERYRKQGRSEARIRRWLQEKHRVQQRDQRWYRELRERSTDDTVDGWFPVVRTVRSTGAASRIGLVVGELPAQPIRGHVTIDLNELDTRKLEEMDEDVLYWVTP